MESHPSPSPASEPSLKLPGIVPALVLYAVCTGLSLVPRIFVAAEWTHHAWLTLPFSFFASFLPIALFLAVFVINEKRAVLVPISGVFATALILHYLKYTPAEFKSQFPDNGLEQIRLRSDLWDAIKLSLPVELLVTGLGIIAARRWSPRVEFDLERTTLPEVKPALIFFFACVIPFAIATNVALRSHGLGYPYGVLEATASEFSLIAMFCICAVALKPWTALLPLVLLGQTLSILVLQPGGCFGGPASECWDFALPIMRNLFITLTLIFMVAVAAGAWAREQAMQTKDSPPRDLDAVEPAV